MKAMQASELPTVDVASGLADAMSPKDEEEIKNVKKAGLLIGTALVNRAFKEVEGEWSLLPARTSLLCGQRS
jgi:nucleosome binding factor SPN SPT16 subunit